MNNWIKWSAVAGLLASSALAQNAFALSCSSSVGSGAYKTTRTWTVNVSTGCDTGPGNPNSSGDLEILGNVAQGSGTFAGTTWTKNGDVSSGGDSSALLNVTLDPGSQWGTQPISGTWTLAAGFWNTYLSAVITMHVGGNPATAPDDFGAFLLTPGVYSGTFAFSQTNTKGGGGGFSNIAVWTGKVCTKNCGGTSVPEPSSLALLGLGVAGLAYRRRRLVA